MTDALGAARDRLAALLMEWEQLQRATRMVGCHAFDTAEANAIALFVTERWMAAPAPAGPDVPYGPCPICGEPRPAHVPRQHVHTIIGAFVAGRSGEEELNRRIQEVIEAQVAWALRDALNAVAARGAPAEGAADCPMCGAPESYGHLCPERRG